MNDKVGDSKPALHDNRVKIEEVEDEDAQCNFHNNAPKKESSPFKGMTPKQEDGPDDWRSVSEAPGESLDEMFDNDDLPEIGDMDDLTQLDILPADFHDNDDVDGLLDLDAINPGTKELFSEVMGSPSSTVPLTPKAIEKFADNDSQWNSVSQLVKFRETSTAIAEDYLKSQGIKLRSRRKSTFTKQSQKAAVSEGKGRWKANQREKETVKRQGI